MSEDWDMPAPSQTGTPRAEAVWECHFLDPVDRADAVYDLARQLERELAEAKGSLSRARAGETLQRKAADAAELALSQAKRDAERYRWLREHFRFSHDSLHELWFDESVSPHAAETIQSRDELDAAIDDAALAKREGEGS